MKAVVASFTGMEDSEEAVTAKTNVLQKSVSTSANKLKLLQGQSERAKAKLDSLAKELENAAQEFGENSQQAIKAQNAYNRQVVAVNKLETQIHQTSAELNRMERELRDVGKAAENMSDDLRDAAKDADTAGSSFRDAFLGGAISGAIQSMVSGISALVDSTTEYRKIMGTLEASSEKAGYSAEQTSNSYQQLYGVIGDNQQTATALANLQALELEQDKLKQMTEGAIGAWATYGDSIPIDGLAEAINETIKAGVVTGSFADMLNWAGTSEDAFNEKLEAAGSQAERANLVLQEMANQGLMQTAEAWRQNNAEIVAANEATANLEATMGSFGEILSPVVTTAKVGMNAFLQSILSIIEAFQEGGMQSGLAEITSFSTDFIQQIQSAIPVAAESLKGLFVSMQTYLSENLPGIIRTGMDFLLGFSEGIREKAGILIDAGLSLVSTLANGIIQSLPVLIETVPQIVTNIAGIINDNAPKVLMTGLTLMKNLVVGLIQSIPTIVQSIPQIIEAAVSVFLAFNWVNLGKSIIISLKDGMLAMTQTVKGTAQNLLSNIETVLSAMPGKMLNLGKQAMQGFINGIKSLFGAIGNTGRSVVTSVVNVFKELPRKLLQVGKDTIAGFVNGIKSALGSAMTAVSTAVASIKSVFTNKQSGFDTHSPSEWSKKVASWVMQGLGIGFKNDTTAVTAAKTATGRLKDIFDEAGDDIKGAMLTAAKDTGGIVPYIRKTSKKVETLLQSEIQKINQQIADMQEQAADERAAAELKQYQENLAEKQKELEKAEKENKQKILKEIEKLEKDWNERQIEAARNAEEQKLKERLKALETFQKEYEDALSEIQGNQKSLQEELSGYGDLFSWVTDENDRERLQLGDLDAEIKKLQEYTRLVDRIRRKGLSEGLMQEIAEMDVDDAFAFMDKLNALSEEKLREFVQKYEEKQTLAARAAEKFYKDNVKVLEESYAEKLPAILGETQTLIKNFGETTAESLKEGLTVNGSALGQAMTQAVNAAVSDATNATKEDNMLQFIAGMQEQMPMLVEYTVNTKNTLLSLIRGFQSEFRTVGNEMMNGVAQGIMSGSGAVINATATVVSAAVRCANQVLDALSSAESGEYSTNRNLRTTIQTMQNSMNMVRATPMNAAATVQTTNNYTHGGINVYVDTINNANDRDVQTLGRELNFITKQTAWGRGGDL